MAFSAHKDPEQIKEHFDSDEELDKNAQVLAKWIHRSEHLIVFTGAGISTSAGIPDFRGPEGTWTLAAQGRKRTSKTVSNLEAVPTPAHMALVELQNRGKLKYLVSQNCDGLHRKSGILPQFISELHGNSNREYCKNCGKEYLRDFRAVASYRETVHDHRTGRKCGACGSDLHDSIVNFNEPLPQKPLRAAFKEAYLADLCIVLGSSLTVSPANEIPHIVASRPTAKLVIVNLQKTPLDDGADLRVFACTDDLMEKVMLKLNLPIPPFIIVRRMLVECRCGTSANVEVSLKGVDVDGTPMSFIKQLDVVGHRSVTLTSEPFIFRVPESAGNVAHVTVHFMGWYGEPSLGLEIQLPGHGEERTKKTYIVEYSPRERDDWKLKVYDEHVI
ncbi:hypothetical protein KP509_04G014200 [Ceratopteris richardii]|uniref:protein acetyllysine N-acetyltransferase n=1 Tax=Ceratopteris richardii TaxID=49495 RepID=A0A8T2UQI5_CERRI|nr:hypothetical protein KP509_04G014200 [Ceratopteris richardii]